MGFFDKLRKRKEQKEFKRAVKRSKKNMSKEEKKQNIERARYDDEIGRKTDYILEHEFDDIALAKEFRDVFIKECEKRKINPDSLFTKYNIQEQPIYKLRTKLSEEKTLKIVQDFFDSIYPAVGSNVRKILEGNGKNTESQKIKLYIDRKANVMPATTSPLYANDDVTVKIPLYGDLRDVYSFVHEIGHTFDCEAGDNETRKIFGEVGPQTLERMLDDYLIEHYIEPADSKLSKSEKNNLMLDIGDRRLSTFNERYKSTKQIPGRRGQDKNISTRYMLTQIYQTHMRKNERNAAKMGLIDYWQAVIDNDYVLAMDCLGLDLRVNNPEVRTEAIQNCVNEFFDMRDEYIKLEQKIENEKLIQSTINRNSQQEELSVAAKKRMLEENKSNDKENNGQWIKKEEL